jgi:Sec-independent protein translocase protein TatA
MPTIVGPELLLLVVALVIVLAWRGPAALPRLGEAFGKAVKGARENMPGGSKTENDAPVGSDATVSSAAAVDASESDQRSGP